MTAIPKTVTCAALAVALIATADATTGQEGRKAGRCGADRLLAYMMLRCIKSGARIAG